MRRREEHHADDDQGERQDTARPAGIERAQRGGPGAGALAQQDTGDDEPGDHEEDIDPQVPERGAAGDVGGDDEDHG